MDLGFCSSNKEILFTGAGRSSLPVQHHLAQARAWASPQHQKHSWPHGLWLIKVLPNPLDIRNETRKKLENLGQPYYEQRTHRCNGQNESSGPGGWKGSQQTTSAPQHRVRTGDQNSKASQQGPERSRKGCGVLAHKHRLTLRHFTTELHS